MRVVLVFSDAICCDTTPRFYLFTCRHSRAGGVLWIARCLIRALKSLRTPLPIQSHLWLFWSDFRESGELCAVLWSFASICEFCRRMKGRDGNDEGGEDTGVVPSSSLHSGATWSLSQPHSRPASHSAKQPTSRSDFPVAGTGLLAPPTPLSHSSSWQDLCKLASAPDVRCRVGRPLPDGHLIVELASRLHHFCIIPPVTEL